MISSRAPRTRHARFISGHPMHWLVFMLFLFTSACQPLTATILPTPVMIQVAYTPALKNWATSLTHCASAMPEIGLVTLERPADQLDPAKVDFALHFGPLPDPSQNTPSPYFAAVMATDEVVVVVNPANPIARLTPQVISAIYQGQVTQWNELEAQPETPLPTDTGQAIQIWAYPLGDDLRQVFDQAFMPGKNPARQTYLAPDAGAMLEAIAKNPGAIGYLLKSQLNPTIHAVKIDGDPAFNLKQPVLALSMKEPQGQARQLLLCMQGN